MKIELQTSRQKVFSFTKRSIVFFLHFGLAMLLVFAPSIGVAQAQSQSVPIIRDAEIEQLLYDYTTPIFKAAGIRNKIQIIVVNDQSFNAFVDGQRMFVNIGALMQAETPNELIGVIAHETGHLANGHQQRLREQIKRAQTMAVIGMLLGIGAGVAGASTGNTSAAGAGGGRCVASRCTGYTGASTINAAKKLLPIEPPSTI